MNRDEYDALVALEPEAARRTGLLFARLDGTAWGQIRTAFAKALEREAWSGSKGSQLVARWHMKWHKVLNLTPRRVTPTA